MACRLLMLFEGVVEVKSFIAVRTTKVMEGVTMALKPQEGVEEAVAMTAETVACSTFVVFQCAQSAEATGAVIAGGHDVASSCRIHNSCSGIC